MSPSSLPSNLLKQLTIQEEQPRVICNPIGRLPGDILYRIFLACPPAQLHIPNLAKQSPWNISQVCHSWRSIVYTSPSLWAHFELHMYNQPPVEVDAECLLKRMRNWLENSKDAPLSASLAVYHFQGTMTCDIIDHLCKEERRWERIYLRVMDIPEGYALPPIHCPDSLRHLEIRAFGSGHCSTVCLEGSGSSNLCSLEVLGHISLISNATQLPNLHRLKYVPMYLQSGRDFLSLLQSSSSAIHLDMSLNIAPVSDIKAVVELSRVRYMELNCEGFRVDQASFFFNNVAFPSLCELSLRVCAVSGNVSTWEAMGKAYRRSNPPLQYFRVNAVGGRMNTSRDAWSDECIQGFTSMLRLMDQVKQLDINDALVTDALLCGLAASAGGKALTCPELESLYLGCPWLPFLGESAILDLVKSRWRCRPNSQSFKLSIRCHMAQPHIGDTLDVEEVEECKREGLKLVLT